MIQVKHLVYSAYQGYIAQKTQQGLYRSLKEPPDTHVLNQAIFFNQNDYLHLSHHPQVIARSQAYAETWGTGSGASRILSYLPIYQELEARIAQTKHKERAMIFNSGYQANSSVLAALLDKRLFSEPPLVFCDRLNHASMHQGCQLAGVKQIRYQHLDLDHLHDLLQRSPKHQPRFIVTESLFSMDGDRVDIAGLVALAEQFNAFLYIDEAHAVGLFGSHGYGLTRGYEARIDLIMGTFSKAIGASGGYVCCDRLIYDYLLNRCQGFIYSTALSPAVIGAIHQAWDLLPQMNQAREALMELAHYTRTQLKAHGFDTGQSRSHIIPIIIGDEAQTMQLYKQLKAQNVYTAAIRPPTVPAHTSRLRISLQANHKKSMVDRLVDWLGSC